MPCIHNIGRSFSHHDSTRYTRMISYAYLPSGHVNQQICGCKLMISVLKFLDHALVMVTGTKPTALDQFDMGIGMIWLIGDMSIIYSWYIVDIFLCMCIYIYRNYTQIWLYKIVHYKMHYMWTLSNQPKRTQKQWGHGGGNHPRPTEGRELPNITSPNLVWPCLNMFMISNKCWTETATAFMLEIPISCMQLIFL